LGAIKAAEIRRRIGHPILDVDAHMLEFMPAVFPYLREALGPELFEDYRKQGPLVRRDFPPMTKAKALASRMPQTAWWGTASDAYERATIMLPALFYERMEDLGFDYCVQFTTNALSQCSVPDAELRAGVCRGFNDYYAETYRPFRDRIAAAGLIPMHTPEEAIAELDHCAAIGLKAVVLPEAVLRPIDEVPPDVPNGLLWPGQRHWLDRYGLDSLHDYDPVWQRARQHGFAVCFHGQCANVPGTYTSPTNYVYNHIGMFAALMAPLCKALFLGGVTRRNPGLPFGFLECGVSWATQMLADAIEHWEKRRIVALPRLDPARLDFDALDELVKRYGGPLAKIDEAERRAAYAREAIDLGPPEEPDEFVHLAADSKQELCNLFSESFYFGCEADDRGVATAFARSNPEGTKLKAMFSSDIGHWDVVDHEGVVPDAHGLIAKGVLNEDQFRAFTFTHSAEMLLSANPAFFEGTAVESEAARLLATRAEGQSSSAW
jgi:predicted TIM-barrel fold metal-dependent hydrolase